ncbi:unnamed protein product [Mucor hiemalis]
MYTYGLSMLESLNEYMHHLICEKNLLSFAFSMFMDMVGHETEEVFTKKSFQEMESFQPCGFFFHLRIIFSAIASICRKLREQNLSKEPLRMLPPFPPLLHSQLVRKYKQAYWYL